MNKSQKQSKGRKKKQPYIDDHIQHHGMQYNPQMGGFQQFPQQQMGQIPNGPNSMMPQMGQFPMGQNRQQQMGQGYSIGMQGMPNNSMYPQGNYYPPQYQMGYDQMQPPYYGSQNNMPPGHNVVMMNNNQCQPPSRRQSNITRQTNDDVSSNRSISSSRSNEEISPAEDGRAKFSDKHSEPMPFDQVNQMNQSMQSDRNPQSHFSNYGQSFNSQMQPPPAQFYQQPAQFSPMHQQQFNQYAGIPPHMQYQQRGQNQFQIQQQRDKMMESQQSNNENLSNILRQLQSIPGGAEATQQLLAQNNMGMSHREMVSDMSMISQDQESTNRKSEMQVLNDLNQNLQKSSKNKDKKKQQQRTDEDSATAQPIQIYLELMHSKYSIPIASLQNFDELYNEKSDGQICIRRNLVTQKFEFLQFIDIISKQPETKTKAIKVARTLDRLNHPNLLCLNTGHVLLDTAGGKESMLAFVQEAPDHMQNWKSFCKRPFSTIQILCIFRQLVQAIQYIHENGIIHRDIHPTRINQINNVIKFNMIGMPYNYKKLLKSDTFCGHLNYSSPEMLQDNPENFSAKLDIWALGCCLYFIASKKDPFEGSSSDEIKRNICNLKIDNLLSDADPSAKYSPQVYIYTGQRDRIIDDLIFDCLQLNQHQRPNADQLLQHLDSLEISYYGKVKSKEIVDRLIDQSIVQQKDFFVTRYAKNPNQQKMNPEFFSKKVGDKLMKIQSLEEMFDTNDIIKKTCMYAEEKDQYRKEFGCMYQFESLEIEPIEEEKGQQNEKSGEQFYPDPSNQVSVTNRATIHNAFGGLRGFEQDSQAASSVGPQSHDVSTYTTKQQRQMYEQQLYDLISDKSKISAMPKLKKPPKKLEQRSQNLKISRTESSKKTSESIKELNKSLNENQSEERIIHQNDQLPRSNQPEKCQTHNINQPGKKELQLKNLMIQDDGQDQPSPQFTKCKEPGSQEYKYNTFLANAQIKDESRSSSKSKSTSQQQSQQDQTQSHSDYDYIVPKQPHKNTLSEKNQKLDFVRLKDPYKSPHNSNELELNPKVQRERILQNHSDNGNNQNNDDSGNQDNCYLSQSTCRHRIDKLVDNIASNQNSSSEISASVRIQKQGRSIRKSDAIEEAKLVDNSPISNTKRFNKDSKNQMSSNEIKWSDNKQQQQSEKEKQNESTTSQNASSNKLIKQKMKQSSQETDLAAKKSFTNMAIKNNKTQTLDFSQDQSSTDQKNFHEEKKNFKEVMQNKRKSDYGVDTNLTKKQLNSIQKMFDRRMSIVVKNKESKQVRLIKDQIESMQKVRSNSTQISLEQVEQIRKMIQNQANNQKINKEQSGKNDVEKPRTFNSQQIKTQKVANDKKGPSSFGDYVFKQAIMTGQNQGQENKNSPMSHQMIETVQKMSQVNSPNKSKEQDKKESPPKAKQQQSKEPVLDNKRKKQEQSQKQRHSQTRGLNQFQSQINSSSEDYSSGSGSEDNYQHRDNSQNCQSQDQSLTRDGRDIKNNLANLKIDPSHDVLSLASMDSKIKQRIKSPLEIEQQQTKHESKSQNNEINEDSKDKSDKQLHKSAEVSAEEIKTSMSLKSKSQEPHAGKKSYQSQSQFARSQSQVEQSQVDSDTSSDESKQIYEMYKQYKPKSNSSGLSSGVKQVKHSKKQQKKKTQKHSSVKNFKVQETISEAELSREQSGTLSSEQSSHRASHRNNQNQPNFPTNNSNSNFSFGVSRNALPKESESQNSAYSESLERFQNQQKSSLSSIKVIQNQKEISPVYRDYIQNQSNGGKKQSQFKHNNIVLKNHSQSSQNKNSQSSYKSESNSISKSSAKQKSMKSKSIKSLDDNKRLQSFISENQKNVKSRFFYNEDQDKNERHSQSQANQGSQGSQCSGNKKDKPQVQKIGKRRGRSGLKDQQMSKIDVFQRDKASQEEVRSLKPEDKKNDFEIESLGNKILKDVIRQEAHQSQYSQSTFGMYQKNQNGKAVVDSESLCRMSAQNSSVNFNQMNQSKQIKSECKHQVVYEDGSKFVGKVLRQGYGEYFGQDGSIYKGMWENDMKHGLGKLQTQNGNMYEGKWENDQLYGMALYTSSNGDIYKGNFKNGVKSGFGIMNFFNGDKFEGQWQDDMIWGENGMFTFVNGNKYTGQFVKGLFEGEGQLTLLEKGKYKGQFSKGAMNGKGTFLYDDGSKYEGMWKECLMHGKGLLTQADGLTIFEGHFHKGLKHGIGTLTKLNESKIKGVWKKDELENMITYENLKALDDMEEIDYDDFDE